MRSGRKREAAQARAEAELEAAGLPHDPAAVYARYTVLLAESKAQRQAEEFAGAYCTKHIYAGRTLVNLVGGIHLTKGPLCDGAKHRNSPMGW